jgi:hypothetical protein
MKIAASARRHLEALLAASELGSFVGLLVGYTYREDGSKEPHIDIQVLPAEAVLEMERSHAEWGDQVIHEFDGFTFALPIPDDDGLLDGHLLVHSEEGLVLVRESH